MPSRLHVRALMSVITFLIAANIIVLVGTVAGPPVSTVGGRLAGSTEQGQVSAATHTVVPASSTNSESTGDSPPVVDAAIDGTLGNNGWYVDDVTVTFTTTDDEESITATDGCDVATVTADTTGETFACTATSDGGSTTTTVVIARDATAPTGVAVTADRAPDNNGWYTAPFAATWTGSDETSAIESCTATDYAGPDTDAGSLPGSCTDHAGNSSDDVAFTFKYDATAPGATATPDRAPDHNGWYNAAVTITFTSDDATATCDAPVTYSGPDTDAASVSGSCADDAGNSSDAAFDFRYDATGPTITITRPADAAIYILRQPVTASYYCSDATSDVATCVGTTDNGAVIDTATVGSKDFTVNATDNAGNAAVLTSAYEVQYQPAGVRCNQDGHTILSPIDADGSSTFKAGSAVPAKFRVYDYFCKAVGSDGVVSNFRQIAKGGSAVDEAPTATNGKPFTSGSQQWIFTISTKGQPTGWSGYLITLNDGTTIDFGFRLK